MVTNITEGDLDNIIKLGTYMCQTGAIARSLSNCPATSAFYMIVVRGHAPAIVYQIIITVKAGFNYVYMRLKGVSSTVSDTNWYRFTGAVVD